MASRRRSREFALQILYRLDLAGADPERALAGLWEGQLEDDALSNRPAEAEEIEFTRRLVLGYAEQKSEVNALIESASVNWRLLRMPVVDRNILRLASFELLACSDIPASVSINEAVELAKRFGDQDSRAFINGILDRIATETGRGGRQGRR